MSDRPNLTVADAKHLALSAQRRWVVIIAEHEGGTQFVTWGQAPEDKIFASDLAEDIAKDYCGPEPGTVYESFKLEAAKNRARVEGLEGVLEQVLNQRNYHDGKPSASLLDAVSRALEKR